MTQEDKNLLLKDLCARLPYGVICKDDYAKIEGKLVQIGINYDMCLLSDDYGETEWAYIPNCKPYLFPLSSMTEEQKEFLIKNYKFTFDSCGDNITNGVYSSAFNRIIYHTINEEDLSDIIDWLNANHFDYRGLIPKGLAIDATDKNVY